MRRDKTPQVQQQKAGAGGGWVGEGGWRSIKRRRTVLSLVTHFSRSRDVTCRLAWECQQLFGGNPKSLVVVLTCNYKTNPICRENCSLALCLSRGYLNLNVHINLGVEITLTFCDFSLMIVREYCVFVYGIFKFERTNLVRPRSLEFRSRFWHFFSFIIGYTLNVYK